MRVFPILLTLTLLFAGELGALELREDDRVIEVLGDRGELVLRYNKKSPALPEGVAELYRRSGFIHPVMTPDGREVTGDFPNYHLHQHGLFLAWTSGRYKGKKIDFWNQKKEEGRVEHREVLERSEEDGAVSFTVRLAHFDQRDAGEKEILNETWKVTVNKAAADHVQFDIESRQTLVGTEPLQIEKYHYGGMALRCNAQWLGTQEQPGCEFLTSEGKTREDGNHSRPNWVAMHGQLAGRPATIVVLGHPENFRAPQAVRLHPDKPYFSFSPMVEAGFAIESAKPYVSRYRYLVTGKRLDKEWVERQWAEYSRK